MPIHYCLASTHQELEQILALQQRNLLEHVSHDIQRQEGFVSVKHDFAVLNKMNEACQHIIAKDGQKVVGYALCMHPKFANEIELLKPMFDVAVSAIPATESFMVMGQICIDKDYRKKGIFRGLYKMLYENLKSEFDSIITSVDAQNERSLVAHYAIGFIELKTYQGKGREWKLIQLNHI